MFNPFRRATARYAVVQGLYWTVYCLMVGFASAFLLDAGFTNGQIGLILGLSYLLSAILQPVVGSLFSRRGLKLNNAIAIAYVPVALASLAVMALPLGHGPLAVLMAVSFTIQSMLQPSVNALHQNLETESDRVNFGLARGVGSAAYALSSFAMGRLLTRFAPSIIPGAYGLAVVALIAVLLCLRTTTAVGRAAVDVRGASYADILREHRGMALFLVGAACMFLTYSFIDSFLLQIITSIGGSSANLGTAITLSAMTELPAMILFSRLSKKGLGLKLFLASIWFWLAKDVLTLLAPSPQALYGVQLLNFASCAVYVPGMMVYMQHTLPQSQLLRGVTLAGTATTLGSLAATLLGGWLIDAVGVRAALLAVQLFAACGTVLLTIALTAAVRRPAAEN